MNLRAQRLERPRDAPPLRLHLLLEVAGFTFRCLQQFLEVVRLAPQCRNRFLEVATHLRARRLGGGGLLQLRNEVGPAEDGCHAPSRRERVPRENTRARAVGCGCSTSGIGQRLWPASRGWAARQSLYRPDASPLSCPLDLVPLLEQFLDPVYRDARSPLSPSRPAIAPSHLGLASCDRLNH